MKNLAKIIICAVIGIGITLPAMAQPTDIQGLNVREARKMAREKKKSPKAPVGGLSAVCKKVSNLSGLLVKTTAGGHIPRSDPRYNGYSIVCAGRCVPFPAKVYHCDGSEAFRMNYYGRWVGNGKSRGYTHSSVGAIRSRSRSLKCSGAGYLASGGNSCLRFNLDVTRNGGV